MNIIKYQFPEGRKLEFKETLPDGDKIERTAVAFSNDAGGEIILGVKNDPRLITGIPEDQLIKLEEKISSIIYENCHPVILPDILVQKIEDKYILIVKISRGSLVPYYIKNLGKEKGVYIRVGSSNRLAGREIIEELERRRRNLSFDSTLVYDADPAALGLNSFKNLYSQATGKKITAKSFEKLGLIKTENDKKYVSVSAVLLSDNDVKNGFFPYSKIECARFKGTKTDTTLDSKTIDGPLFSQPGLALSFVERNISKGSKIGRIFREERWEYPLLAIRELIINAVIHRDYSLLGKDIKIAIFDDMLEITSPGVIPPSIDLNNLDSGQSEIRNKILAPIFKELKLIEQWGTGFQKLSEELKSYPEIELKINEPGLSFQVQFIKKDYHSVESPDQTGINLGPSSDQVGTKLALSWHQVRPKLALSQEEVRKVLLNTQNPVSIAFLMKLFGWRDRSKFRLKFISPFLALDLASMTNPDKPNSSKQKYLITEKGKLLLDELETEYSLRSPGSISANSPQEEQDRSGLT